ncbi:MAG: hypothetical protein N2515_06360 [Deltaproteobacteria bacterium]|nr:hypothetical protein [Deltaproteobacteria bacterium]
MASNWHRIRRRRLLGFGVFCGALLAEAAMWLASFQSHELRSDARRFFQRTASTDLALSSHSRWLRHLGLAEAGAACPEGPPCIDTDPGGALLRVVRFAPEARVKRWP